jgi:tetratricopeptide (TPR) repeat protein
MKKLVNATSLNTTNPSENHFIRRNMATLVSNPSDMYSSTRCRHFCICLILLCTLAAGCKSRHKGTADGSYTPSAGDTTVDFKAVNKKADDFVNTNRLDDAIYYLSINLHRFDGAEKAHLLNTRGEAYFLLDDADKAVSDYIAASEADPENSAYLLNVANTYESMNSRDNAELFAQKVLDMKNPTDSDRAAAEKVVFRCKQINAAK